MSQLSFLRIFVESPFRLLNQDHHEITEKSPFLQYCQDDFHDVFCDDFHDDFRESIELHPWPRSDVHVVGDGDGVLRPHGLHFEPDVLVGTLT